MSGRIVVDAADARKAAKVLRQYAHELKDACTAPEQRGNFGRLALRWDSPQIREEHSEIVRLARAISPKRKGRA